MTYEGSTAPPEMPLAHIRSPGVYLGPLSGLQKHVGKNAVLGPDITQSFTVFPCISANYELG